jgi:hypothetical protein
MDKQLAAEWAALKQQHDDAHFRYLYVHGILMDRVASAIKGIRWPTPLVAELQAHEAATDRWDVAKRKLHAFCRAHEDVC